MRPHKSYSQLAERPAEILVELGRGPAFSFLLTLELALMDGKRSDWDMSTRALAASTLYCAASILGLDTKASPTQLFKIGSEKLSTQYIVGKSIGAGTVHFSGIKRLVNDEASSGTLFIFWRLLMLAQPVKTALARNIEKDLENTFIPFNNAFVV
jgi:hypothetical protein